MKVLFLHSQCENGGISRIIFSICDLLKKDGSEGKFAFSRGFIPDNHKDICYMFGNKSEIATHVLLTRLFDRHATGSSKATKELIKFINSYQPDIIHINNIHGYYLNFKLLFDYLKLINIPIVWTLHDCWAFTGHCSHFEYAKCDKWKTNCNQCAYISEYPKSIIFDNSNKNYQEKKNMYEQMNNIVIVTPSLWLKKHVEQSILSDKECIVINNGIDLNIFRYTESSLKKNSKFNNKTIYLAVASVWTQKKGFNDLIEFSKMIDKNTEQLIVVGVNKKQEKKLKKVGIFPITHTKDVFELVKWYSLADVFINPTYEDTFPTVNIESLACGTPVVTYKTGGSPEIIDSNCGVVVKKGRVDLLYKAANMIKSNPYDCRKRALKYDQNERFMEYIDLYKKILEKEKNKK